MLKWIPILCTLTFFVQAEEKSLYWLGLENNDNKIVKTSLNGKVEKKIVENARINEMAVNTKSEKIYWIEGRKKRTLRCANLDGTENVKLIKLDKNARSISTDDNNLYWVIDGYMQTEIIKADLNGENQQKILEGKNISCVTVDTQNQRIFWVVDNGISQWVRTCSLNSKVKRTILRGDSGPFVCFCVDRESKWLYWVQSADNVTSTIYRCDFDGKQKKEILEASFVSSIAVANGSVFWVGRNAGGNAVFRTELKNPETKEIFFTGKKIQKITIK